MLNLKFDYWKKGYICKKPLNPDQLYIKCYKFNWWFHPKCCGFDEKIVIKLVNLFALIAIKINFLEFNIWRLNIIWYYEINFLLNDIIEWIFNLIKFIIIIDYKTIYEF